MKSGDQPTTSPLDDVPARRRRRLRPQRCRRSAERFREGQLRHTVIA
ncbi:hypothetical protein ACFPM0_06945 [Pseudonocardia sulfidoxydans]